MNRLVEVSRALRDDVEALCFGAPVSHVYNPLAYAWEPHRRYLQRFGERRGRVVLLGMNPGPFGMAQTGVPFGDVGFVRDWMGIAGPVAAPRAVHPSRPVEGFACTRSEVSGSRLWGWAKARFGAPEAFFAEFFVLNYCPLAFLEASGRNRTPDKLPRHERAPLFEACDRALSSALDLLQPRLVVGVGDFAFRRAQAVTSGRGLPVGMMLHPSPASPRANRGWEAIAEQQLSALGALPGPRVTP